MPRKFVSFRSISASSIHLFASFWISVLLSICHITDVSAMIPATPAAILSTKIDIGARHVPVGYCQDGYECPDQEPPAQYHSRVDRYDEDYDNGWYARPDPREPHIVTECDDDYEVVEVLPVPEPYYYDPYRHSPCGVRCWYKRLTSGYCGRGCEYYLYRIGKPRRTCHSRH